MRLSPFSLAVPFALAAGEAVAQSQPQLIPTRDVDVTYRVSRAGQELDQRVRWLAAEKLERVDSAGAVYMIVDHKSRRLTLVDPGRKAALEMDAPPQSTLHPDEHAAYTRGNTDMVAGLRCTEWAMAPDVGRHQQLCVTDDGVLLRVRDGTDTVVQATSVEYRRLDPATFRLPPAARSVPPAAAPPPPGTGALPMQP